MASSGTIDGAAGYGGIKIRIKWSINSQSTSNNSSSVNVGVYVVLPSSWHVYSWMRGSFTVNGETRNIDVGSRDYYAGETLLTSSDFTIYHNADGTKSFNMSATVKSGWASLGTMPTASGSGTLNTIPRASQPSINTYPNNSPNFNIGDKITIYMNRASTSFTHTVKFNYGATSVTVATGVTNSCTFDTATIANALYALIPNANSYNGTISVTTYNGSTNIGSKTCAYTAKVTNANPTFSVAYFDSNASVIDVTDNNQIIVRNKSTLVINITNAVAQKYATLATAKVTGLGSIIRTVNLNSSSVAINMGTVNSSQDVKAAITVTDSRGNSTSKTLNITVADWQAPTAIISVKRHNNFYSETDINVDADYSSVNNKNTINIQVRYKKQTDTEWSEYETLEDSVTSVLTLDNDYAWDIQVLLTDKFGSTTYNAQLSRGMPIVYFDRIKSSTGFNCFPQYNQSVEVDGRLFVNNEDIVSKFTGIGGVAKSATTSDWNTACQTLSGIYMGSSMANAPNNSSNWFFVLHMVHNDKYQRQLAFDFFSINIFTRRMDNGTWGAWEQVNLT